MYVTISFNVMLPLAANSQFTGGHYYIEEQLQQGCHKVFRIDLYIQINSKAQDELFTCT